MVGFDSSLNGRYRVAKMTKHTTITRNLLTLTGCLSLDSALKGWQVRNLISENDERKYSVCELCGTPFLNGAVIRYGAKKQTVTVGGTCLGTILEKSFPDRQQRSIRSSDIQAELVKRYGTIIDPGNWIRWMQENSPPHLAEIMAILQYCDRISSRNLSRLVRFHDKTRLYPRHALVPHWRIYSKSITIPNYLTILESRRILKGLDLKKEPSIISGRSRAYMREVFKPLIDEFDSLQEPWDRMSSLEQRSLLALCRLSDLRKDPSKRICHSSIAASFESFETWPRRTGFAWNPRIGVGIIFDDNFDENRGAAAWIWLWHTRDFGENKYDLNYWYGFKPDSRDVLSRLETLAFSKDF